MNNIPGTVGATESAWKGDREYKSNIPEVAGATGIVWK